MKHLKTILIFLFLFPSYAIADIAVFVHGYHATGGSWRHKGITQLMVSRGWRDAGFYAPIVGNIGYQGQSLNNQGHWFVTTELPSELPIEIQASLLGQYLQNIHQRAPGQKIHLIAHSAGGIVARLALVKNTQLPITQLITIATPHLGSPMAEVAESAAESPISWISPLMSIDGLERSETVFGQLAREKENYFLFWLNRQPHPQISYISIVRGSGSLLKGDRFVPPYSQNMALVPAIGQRSRMIRTPGNHKLKYADGLILLSLLPH